MTTPLHAEPVLWGCADGNGIDPRLVFRDKNDADHVAADADMVVQPLYAAAPTPTSLQKTQTSAPDPDEMREAIEQEVGRAVYERIETLMGRDSAELDYLTDFASSVEKDGFYSGPAKWLAAPALSSKQVDDIVEASSSVNLPPAPLREAAQAVVDRWDSPLWKDAEATAHVINRLRQALAQPAPKGGGRILPQTEKGS